uniref:Uncharacterized protein n=1 Tax=Setaria italica TaxID=4555 RepID=K4AN95_SETIT
MPPHGLLQEAGRVQWLVAAPARCVQRPRAAFCQPDACPTTNSETTDKSRYCTPTPIGHLLSSSLILNRP